MKQLIHSALLVGLLLNLALDASHAQDASKADTVSWLLKKLNNYRYDYSVRLGDSVSIGFDAYNNLSFANNVLAFTNVRGSVMASSSYAYSVPLANLIPLCKVKPSSFTYPSIPLYELQIEAAQKGAVQMRFSNGKVEFHDRVIITFADEDLASRVAKALEHLIKLSGGTAEPF